MAANEEKYCFAMEWFDPQADLIRRYSLTFYPRDNSIDMYDLKTKRPFLKRMEYPDVSLQKLNLGSIVTVHGRQLKVIQYADSYTKKKLESQKGRTLALVKPDAYNHIGTVISTAQAVGFVIARLRMVRMSPEQVTAFCAGLSPSVGGGSNQDCEHLAADVVVVMELVGDNAVAKWKQVVGPSNVSQAHSQAPKSLRGQLATDDVRNAVHASEDEVAAEREIDFFFGRQGWGTTAVGQNCTLVAVKPHAFHAAGEIVSAILQAGFEISAMGVWYMDRATAEEFLEVYKGVVPEFHDNCAQFSSGPSLIMEVRQEDAVKKMREFAGPHDPEVAKHLRPDTLRAKYGIDRVQNGVHCTDLEEDGLLEVEYFFHLMHHKSA
jgi:nucleoside-diphosphate kinase